MNKGDLVCPICGGHKFKTQVKPNPLGQYKCKKCGKIIIQNMKGEIYG